MIKKYTLLVKCIVLPRNANIKVCVSVYTEYRLYYLCSQLEAYRSSEHQQTTNKPPQFVRAKDRVYARSNATLELVVELNAPAAVTWLRDDRAMRQTRRVSLIAMGAMHVLKIIDVLKQDQGKYVVRATNDRASKEMTINVSVTS